ncbi:MAG TPA: molybdate ABC transporter substrate-binding protein [Geobacteraceae bacterium]
MKKGIVTICCALVVLFVVSSVAMAGEIRLSVAASLKDVINELSTGFTRTHPGVTVVRNFGASGALAQQIENGAPADVFFSANREWMEYLKGKGLVDGASIGTFAYNTLVFAGIAPKAMSMQDLPRLGRIAIGSPQSVPAGEYAMEAMGKAGIERQLAGKLVMAKDVRACLMYAERGEVDGAFVYRTDALQAKRARILFTVPQELYPRVTYPMGLTVSGARKGEVRAFYRFLQSGEARAILAKYGFDVR